MAFPAPKAKGDPLVITAEWFNQMTASALQAARSKRLGGEAQSVVATHHQLVVRVKNTGANEIPRFRPCTLEDSLFEPETQSPEQPLVNMMTIKARGTAEISQRVPQIGITTETIQPGAIGRAALVGAVPTVVSVGNALHDSCDVTPGTGTLVSMYGGSFPIVWKESGTGSKTAIVLLGGRVGIVVRAGKVTSAPVGETVIESCVYSIQPTGLPSGALMTAVTPWRPTSFANGTKLMPAVNGDDCLLIDFPLIGGGVTTRVLLSEKVSNDDCAT